MELSRFHHAITAIAKDYKISDIENELPKLVANLNAIASNPGNEQVSQTFKDQLNELRQRLKDSVLNSADGDLLETLSSLDLTQQIGDGLFLQIRELLDENQLTPNLAATAIDELRKETINKLSTVKSLDDAFTKLEVDYWGLEEGQTEMRISIPMESETKTLEDIGKEVKEWHQICRAISEIFDIDKNKITVRAVSSGSILLYLASTAVFIYGFAHCLKGINSVLTEIVKSRSLLKQLVESNAPQEAINILESHNSVKANSDLKKLANTLVEEHYKGADEGRKNELENSLSITLHRLSHKLAEGATINLRIEMPKEPTIKEGEQATADQTATLEKIDLFKKIQLEVDASKALLDYQAHTDELIAALPAPTTDEASA